MNELPELQSADVVFAQSASAPQVPLERICSQMVHAIGASNSFAEGLAKLFEFVDEAFGGAQPYSTACSGTDFTHPVLKMLSHVVRPAGDADFKHIWSCECSLARLIGYVRLWECHGKHVHGCERVAFALCGTQQRSVRAGAVFRSLHYGLQLQ